MSGGQPVRRLADWDREQLGALAAAYDTPAYVIDLDRVLENLDRLQAAFPRTDIHYAVKANAGRAVLETLAEAGIGVECASAGEVLRAQDASFPSEAILYTPVNPPDRDLDTVVERWRSGGGLTITAGATDTIDRLADRGYDGRVAIRVHPGTGAGHDEAVSTGADAKFGIPLDAVPDAVEQAQAEGMDVVGLHAHVGSGITNDDIDSHRAVVETLATLAEDLPVDLEYIDVGGGLGVPYEPTAEPLDLDRIAESTRDALAGIDARTVIEPGRYLVADAGVLVTKVTTVKETSPGVIAGVDAGMTDLLRPALYDSFHDIRVLAGDADARETRPVTVAGPICESTDVFARDRELPRPMRGDLVAVGNAGAYGIEMASQYNSRPRPPVVALEDGTDQLVRRRETVADIVEPEVP